MDSVSMNESDFPWYDGVFNWIDKTKHLHATIQTIMDMPKNTNLVFACFDEDVFHIVGEDLDLFYQTEERILPSDMLNSNYHVQYTKLDGNIGEFGNGNYILAFNKHEIDNPRSQPQIEDKLYVEHAPNKWKRLRNYSEIKNYPPTTRIGWRGPMISLEILDSVMIEF